MGCGISEAAVASCCIKCEKLHHFHNHEGFRWWIFTIYLCPPAFICEPETEMCWEMFNHWASCGGEMGEVLLVPKWFSAKEPLCQGRRHKSCGFDPWVRKIPGRGNGNPLQYSCLENPMDRGTWWATVHGFAKSQTWLSNWALPQSHLTHHWLISSYQHEATERRFGKNRSSLRRQYKSSPGHCWSGVMIRAMQSVPLVQLKCCCAVIFHFILNALPPTIPNRIE